MSSSAALVLRLAGPLQSWGTASQFNRRETGPEPTKSGVVGLLAAAQGRRRSEPIEDLLGLTLAVRTDQAGSLLRDYHTVSDYRGLPLPSAAVDAKGRQKSAGKKATHVTQRFYLQDAVFVVAVHGEPDLLGNLADAVLHPRFALALGRRSCVPTQPVLLLPEGENVHPYRPRLWSVPTIDGSRPTLDAVLARVGWQAGPAQLDTLRCSGMPPSSLDLPIVCDDPAGDDVRADVPRSFAPDRRGFGTRRVRTGWVRVATPFPDGADAHDPFALLGW